MVAVADDLGVGRLGRLLVAAQHIQKKTQLLRRWRNPAHLQFQPHVDRRGLTGGQRCLGHTPGQGHPVDLAPLKVDDGSVGRTGQQQNTVQDKSASQDMTSWKEVMTAAPQA